MPEVQEKQSRAVLGTDATQPKDLAKGTPRKRTMQDFLQKTGANLRATGASIKARGALRIPRKKAKVVKPSSKRNSQVHVRTMDISDDVLDKIMGPPQGHKASDGFLEKQRKRASVRRLSSGISPLSTQSQTELEKRPLSASEVEAMFVGAPYFDVQERDGRYKPRVMFRNGDARLFTILPPDHHRFSHSSFATSTLARSRSARETDRPSWSSQKTGALKAGCDMAEIPNMLTSHGLDPGTVGFEHFLQLPLSDKTFDVEDPTALEKKRQQLLLDPECLGLRELNLETLVNRLTDLGELHTGAREQQASEVAFWNTSRIEEMGEELFGKMLGVELGTTSAGAGSVSLKTQINALQRVLNMKDLWHDFSIVEWRVRVGQLLWASNDVEHNQLGENRQPRERDVLLLQITLAAELMIRLHALEVLISPIPPVVRTEDELRSQRTTEVRWDLVLVAEESRNQRTTKIRWDLLLAERFLENLNISIKIPSESEKTTNRSSFFSAITFLTAKETAYEAEKSPQPVISAKNEAEQLAGLSHFAEAIRWPHAENVRTELESKLFHGSNERPVSMATSIYATPLSSPKFPSTPGTRTSFFGISDQQRRPGFSRTATAQSVSLLPARDMAANAENSDVGGWLTRSWLSGLVLPGPPAQHFLISMLLENSPQAIAALGEEANLDGGFIYEGRSFWSKSSVVGRVLAASKGAAECMGWVSVPETTGIEDGWVSLDVKEVPSSLSKQRIKDVAAVAKNSAPLPEHKVEAVEAVEYIRPADGPLIMGNDVICERLSFTNIATPAKPEISTEGDDNAEAPITSAPCLTFRSPNNSKLGVLTVPLTYDVHFICSYPCHPKPAVRRCSARAPSPPVKLSFENKDSAQTPKSEPRTWNPASARTNSKRPSNPSSMLDLAAIEAKELPTLPAHPLHVDYHYSIVPVASLLSMPSGTRPRTLSSPTERKVDSVTLDPEDVVVLDCRGPEDLELLGRAWCAKIGESAVIGKSGRTCLSCCVREARALGVCFVVRT
ncbi:hypothetical protein LTR37_019204 [Vermiconidia calcicola]|uniref:Uncharacterized protein n=1 Tax=Vermiconidia calcicola TaxID=1690605 RepID=A0ACC3MGL0_9PEZI|nr:hypothetical protein LTR37_019204 [Vermiconidia calcicola]